MELLRNENDRIRYLVEYLKRLAEGPVSREVFDLHAALLSTATASEINEALDAVLAGGIEAWKVPVARFIRSASRGLDAEPLPIYEEGSLLARLDKENEEIAAGMSAIQVLAQAARGARGARAEPGSFDALRKALRDFALLRRHYVALQNELFPLFERAEPRHACLKLMWAMQDEVLALQNMLAGNGARKVQADETAFWKTLGDFFLTAGSLVYREKRILLPLASRAVPGAPQSVGHEDSAAFSCGTGRLESGELEAIFKVLPFDVSFIDSDDRVKFYSDPPGRIFPRSPEVVGRLVQNCHPPRSVPAVEEILRAFRNGEKDIAEFWITSGTAFIHIQYFAVRDGKGRYLGTLEVSQDATHMRSLQGEKRLP